MSLHLFSTPVQCTQCGTTVEDPSVERGPTCGARLKERRAPRRLAGVEQRYGSLRVLLGIMRFLGVVVFAIGALVFFSGLGTTRASASQSGMLFIGSILIAVVFLAAAGLFELLIDVEENTRSSFKLQQMILEELAEGRAPAAEAAAAPAPAASAPVAAPAADGAPLAPAAA
jgi:hypothetical protein